MPGGNLNYAFVVRDDKNAVFVKQAPDYIKVRGVKAGSRPSLSKRRCTSKCNEKGLLMLAQVYLQTNKIGNGNPPFQEIHAIYRSGIRWFKYVYPFCLGWSFQLSNVFFFLGCRDLVRSAVPTFAAKAFLLCFAGARSRAKPQAKALINQARLFLRRLFA